MEELEDTAHPHRGTSDFDNPPLPPVYLLYSLSLCLNWSKPAPIILTFMQKSPRVTDNYFKIAEGETDRTLLELRLLNSRWETH